MIGSHDRPAQATSASLRGAAAEKLRRRRVGGKERFQRELRHRDVDRRAEHGGGAEERHHAGIGDELKRDDDRPDFDLGYWPHRPDIG